MIFIDDLGFELFTLPLISATLIYTILRAYYNSRSNVTEIRSYLLDGVIPVAGLGALVLVMALFNEFTWTLPGSYNILFYDVYALLGLSLLLFALAIKFGYKLQLVGFFALLSGLITIYYGIVGYRLGMTEEPPALLGLYVLYGLTGVFSYPMTLTIDRVTVAKVAGKDPKIWSWAIYLFVIFALLAGLLGAYIAIFTIPAHLAHAP
ncbi:MAG: DUF981 family protein [Sulfolobaceae archaeon]|nr:DUF981 family protein [Sulfolobaceae archaeon]